MRRLLFHSYHFPPMGGSGAQRPLKFVRALQGFGYEPIVVTRGGVERDERRRPRTSRSLPRYPRRSRSIASTAYPSRAEDAPWRPLAERWLGVRDRWTRWWIQGSVQLGLDAGGDVDLVYVWMQPYVSARRSSALAALGKPWVADLGDPWALDEMIVVPLGLSSADWTRRRMGKLLGPRRPS